MLSQWLWNTASYAEVFGCEALWVKLSQWLWIIVCYAEPDVWESCCVMAHDMGYLLWSLWPNTRFLPSIVVEKNVHICSMCIKNQLSRQAGSRNQTGPKTLPTIWGTCMKLVTKYQISAIKLLRKISWKDGRTDRQTDRGKTVYPLRAAGV